MMNDSALNPEAAAFVPGSPLASHQHPTSLPDSDVFEDACFYNYFEPSEAERAELRAVDEWVETMAELEEMEVDHLINVALAHADPVRVYEIRHYNRLQQLQPSLDNNYAQGPSSTKCTAHKSCMNHGGKCMHGVPRRNLGRHAPAHPRR